MGWVLVSQVALATEVAPASPPEPAPTGAEAPAPAPPVETEVLEISTDATLSSAVDSLDSAHQELSLEERLPDWIPLPGNLVRGRWVIRPVLGAEAAGGPVAVRLGAALGHQWWTLGEGAVRAGGEETVRLTAPLGVARGRRVDLAVAGGPWIGPVGLRVGPTLSWDQVEYLPGEAGSALLPEAVLVGGSVDLSVVGGPLALTVGVEPAAVVSGERAGADAGDAPLPVLGDETSWRAGLGLLGEHGELLLGAALRQTAIGAIAEGTLGVRVRLL